jgi:uncharacterized protein (DUF58 family)
MPALLVSLAGALAAAAGEAVLGLTVTVPGMALLVLGLLSLVWLGALNSLSRLSAHTASSTVVAGQPLVIELDVFTPGMLQAGAIQIRHPFLTHPLTPPGGRRQIRLEVPTRGRGWVSVAAPVLSIGDPFGLARVNRRAAGSLSDVLVLPRPESVRWSRSPLISAGSGRFGSPARGVASLDLLGLRPYQASTPVNRIHWPALARGGDLLERVFRSEREDTPAVLLDARCGPGADSGMALDRVVAATASVLLALARLNGVDLHLYGRSSALHVDADLRGWATAWRALALVPRAPLEAPAPRLSPRSGPLILACTGPRGSGAGTSARRNDPVFLLTPESTGDRCVTGRGALLRVCGCILTACPAGS